MQDNKQITACVTSGAHIWARNLVLSCWRYLSCSRLPPVFFRSRLPFSGHILFASPHARDKIFYNDLLCSDTCSEIGGANGKYAELGPCEKDNKQRKACATSGAHT